MRIEELSIGDWVRYRDREWQVCSLYQFTEEVGLWRKDSQVCENITDISPIPLTTEILEKNGFERQKNPNVFVATNSPNMLYVDLNSGVTFVNYMERECFFSALHIEFVHQLQHSLRLAGVGKDIEL